ncbi:MAG: hypothetical protein QOE45_2814 [Frankiaceae bacterium]|jgi:hypothetical protein|nr:hypothetical protein [Frankiaceae bacterium]
MATPEVPTGKLAQIRQMVSMTREADPRYLPIVLVAVVLAAGVAFTVGQLLAGPILGAILALLAALIAFTVVTGRRGQAAAFTRIEGQPGAAFAILQSLRGDWRVTPAVAYNKSQDLVHRAVGRPGVILVAEGSGARARELLSAELRRTRKVIGEAPLHDVVIGEGEGQVPLKRLQVHVMKLPRALKPKEVNAVESRLKALGGTAMPLPKGPMPTRVPRGGKIR